MEATGKCIRMATRPCGIALLLVVLATCGEPGVRKPTEAPKKRPKELPALFRAMPDSTILAFALTDLDKWRSDLKRTALHDAWQDPKLAAWREQSWPKFKAVFAEKTGFSAEEVDSLLHGDVLVVLSLSKRADSFEPGVDAALLVKTTTNKVQVEALLKKVLEKAGAGAPAAKWADDVLIVTKDGAFADQLAGNLKAERSPLEDRKGYKALKTDYEPDAYWHLWIDVNRILEFALADEDEAERAEAMPVLQQVGLDNLTAVYLSSSIYKKGLRSSAWVRFDGARKGIFSWFGGNGPSKAIRLAPPEAQNFISLRHAGADKILATIRAITLAAPDSDEENWKEMMAEANQALGINLETDLPRLVGNELALTFQGTSLMDLNIALFVESGDPKGLIAVAERLLAKGPLQPQEATHEGVTYKYVNVPGMPLLFPIQVAFGPLDDFVVVSMTQPGFRRVVDTRKAKKSLADDPSYVNTLAELGAPGWEVIFGKGPQIPSTMSPAMMAPMIVQGLNNALGTDFVPADIPDIQVLLAHQGPSATISRTYTDAIEAQAYASSGLPLNITDVPALGIGVAIAIPGFMRAREVARATSCQENLIKLEGSVDQWAVEHDKEDGDKVNIKDLVGPTLYLKRTPRCRGGGDYGTTFTVGVTPTCTYVPPAWFDTGGGKYAHKIPDAVE